MRLHQQALTAVLVAASLSFWTVQAAAQDPSMVRGLGWRTDAIFTIGGSIGGFTPTGRPDGIGAFSLGDRALILVNSELEPADGYTYALKNGTKMTGGRITAYEVRRFGHVGIAQAAGLAYDTVYDRRGNIVTAPFQVNETGKGIDGFSRFCSGKSVRAGTYGFVDDIYFAHEETRYPNHPHGGSVWALDVKNKTLWAVPALGRNAFENVAPIDTGDKDTIGLLVGVDTETSPLYLYIGKKNSNGNFLDRNGLLNGQVYYWRADNGDTTPQKFNGLGNKRSGKFVAISVRETSQAGKTGHDNQGYLNDDTLRVKAQSGGAFRFSRPEDIHTNPKNGLQVVYSSTGRGSVYPADNWGTVYRIDVTMGTTPTATVEILHDADGLSVPDTGIRSPDNLTWASDGKIYLQEDSATSPSTLFGAASKIDASIWQLDPATKKYTRIGVVNRSVLLPVGVTDANKGQLGAWETSGILDVTDVFPTAEGETLLIATTMPHGLEDGPVGGKTKLVESGQLLFLSNLGIDHAIECADNSSNGATITVNISNGTPNSIYGLVLAGINAGKAPLGWFFGVDVTSAELGLLIPPLVGLLDANGERTFSARVSKRCPLGYYFDAVVVELGPPLGAGPAVTHRL